MTRPPKKRWTGGQVVDSYFWGNCPPLKRLYLGEKYIRVDRWTVIYY